MEQVPEQSYESESILEFKDVLENPIRVEILDESVAQNILRNTQIHSDTEQSADAQIYQKNGLEPYALLTREGHGSFAFSRPYMIVGDRVAFVGYGQEQDGSYTARSYYLSNSHAVFKYLPSYFAKDDGMVAWFHKGFGEQSIALGYPLQRSLSHILDTTPIVSTKDSSLDIFISTARDMSKFISSTYSLTVKEKGKSIVEGDSGMYGERMAPEDIEIKDEQSPNFSDPIAKWQQTNNLYGEITITAFESKDRTILYTFGSDAGGRAWIANIEPIDIETSIGIHSTHISSRSLTTPAFEYVDESDSYGDFKLHKGKYVDMYQNYLSKMKVIQDFTAQNTLPETKEIPVQN